MGGADALGTCRMRSKETLSAGAQAAPATKRKNFIAFTPPMETRVKEKALSSRRLRMAREPALGKKA